MTEPLKPRIDFTGQLEQSPHEAFKTAQTFSGPQADNLLPCWQTNRWLKRGRRKRLLMRHCARNAACGARW